MNDSSLFPINDLPDELLAGVFRRVSWTERFDLELVCHRWRGVAKRQGWTDEGMVEGLTIDDGMDSGMLANALARCGQQLQWLYVQSSGYLPERLIFRRCPNIRHLRLGNIYLDPPLVRVIRKLYAGQLKSLSLDQNYRYHCTTFKGLLDAFGATLEFVEIDAFSPYGLFNSKLSSGRRFFAQLSEGRQFSQLCSLYLVIGREVTLSPLQHLPRLVHLSLRFHGCETSESTFIDILHCLTNLKSLVIFHGSPRLLEAIARECHQLEHLGWELTVNKSLRQATLKALTAIGFGLENLRSLEIKASSRMKYDEVRCDWMRPIVERGKLEFLNVGLIVLPKRVLYEVIRKCPRLVAISIGNIGKYSPVKLAAVAAETEALNGEASLPRIYIKVQECRRPEVKKLGRIVFLDLNEHKALKSHVLHHYRYGCLSEGRPNWEAMK